MRSGKSRGDLLDGKSSKSGMLFSVLIFIVRYGGVVYAVLFFMMALLE